MGVMIDSFDLNVRKETLKSNILRLIFNE